MEFGQTIIAKMRSDLPQLPRYAVAGVTQTENKVKAMTSKAQQNSLFSPDAEPGSTLQKTKPTLDQMTNDGIKSGFDPAMIGKHIIELSSQPDGIEQCVAYVAIISKARKARLDRGT